MESKQIPRIDRVVRCECVEWAATAPTKRKTTTAEENRRVSKKRKRWPRTVSDDRWPAVGRLPAARWTLWQRIRVLVFCCCACCCCCCCCCCWRQCQCPFQFDHRSQDTTEETCVVVVWNRCRVFCVFFWKVPWDEVVRFDRLPFLQKKILNLQSRLISETEMGYHNPFPVDMPMPSFAKFFIPFW